MDQTPSAPAGPPGDEPARGPAGESAGEPLPAESSVQPPAGSPAGPSVELPVGPTVELPGDDTRRYPSTIGGLCYLAIVAVFGVGLVLAALGTWRTGIRVSAASLMVASVLRLALPRRDAGMLAVRHRVVDALVLAGSAAALLFLAATIPDQPV